MQILITDLDTGELDVSFKRNYNSDEPGVHFQDVYARLMAALEGAVNTLIKEIDVPDKQAFRNHLYDVLDDGFGNFLMKVFPEIDVNEFNLSAAAIVYAQDCIIQKAEAEGKTYAEMLEEYEAIADAYIKEKRMN